VLKKIRRLNKNKKMEIFIHYGNVNQPSILKKRKASVVYESSLVKFGYGETDATKSPLVLREI